MSSEYRESLSVWRDWINTSETDLWWTHTSAPTPKRTNPPPRTTTCHLNKHCRFSIISTKHKVLNVKEASQSWLTFTASWQFSRAPVTKMIHAFQGCPGAQRLVEVQTRIYNTTWPTLCITHTTNQVNEGITTEKLLNCIISQTSRSMHNMDQKNDSSTRSKKFFAEKKNRLNQVKHTLEMNAGTQAGIVPKTAVSHGIKEKQVRLND